MEYRQATAADVPALAAMNGQLIRDEGHRNPMTGGELADRMAGWLAGDYEAILFEEGGSPLGMRCIVGSPSTSTCGICSSARRIAAGGRAGGRRLAPAARVAGRGSASRSWSATRPGWRSGGPSVHGLLPHPGAGARAGKIGCRTA